MEFNSLYQEMAHGAETVSKLVAGITPKEARFKPTPESWSILEVICHLYDEEREDFRPRLDIMLHRPTEKWPPIDPTGWVAARKYNERNLVEMMGNFVAERQNSLAWLKGLASPNWEAEYTTPFGVMKAGDMLGSWVAHDHLHLRQLVELRRARVLQLVGPYDVRYAGEW
ncbi:MAG TPA: DinB family protein [Anaerolineae bacterium]|nr:DinB family protein [Anaerolineae bacterium]